MSDAPTCRECGSVALTRDGKVTCSSCGYVAGTALAVMRMRATHDNHGAALLALAEARDEGVEAGWLAALEEAARVADDVVEEYRSGKLRIGDWTAHEAARRIRREASGDPRAFALSWHRPPRHGV